MGQTCACGHSKGRHQTTNLGNVTHCADCGCGSFSEYETPPQLRSVMMLDLMRLECSYLNDRPVVFVDDLFRLAKADTRNEWSSIDTLEDPDREVLMWTPTERLHTKEQLAAFPGLPGEQRVSTKRHWTWATHWKPLPTPPEVAP